MEALDLRQAAATSKAGEAMSAYLASQQTYDYIANGLYDVATNYGNEHHYTIRKFLDIDSDATPETLETAIRTAVRKLYDLNRLALVTRYGDTWDRNSVLQLEIKEDASIKPAQFIQCIACVLYQCSEYLTDETATYKKWRGLQYELAYSYFERSPECESTKWNMSA